MHKLTRVTAIPKSVKERVLERDGGKCVLCGRNNGEPNAHYIGRAHGGKGIEQNILTLCRRCHDAYDNGADRKEIRKTLKAYLESKYDDWNEEQLIYSKWEVFK